MWPHLYKRDFVRSELGVVTLRQRKCKQLRFVHNKKKLIIFMALINTIKTNDAVLKS